MDAALHSIKNKQTSYIDLIIGIRYILQVSIRTASEILKSEGRSSSVQFSNENRILFLKQESRYESNTVLNSIIMIIKMKIQRKTANNYMEMVKTRFGGRGFGRPTFWQTSTSVANHEDMDSLFPFLTIWEAHIIQLNFFLVH